MHNRIVHDLVTSFADAGWFILGLAAYALTLGAFTVEVECYLTHNTMRFQGWHE